MTDEFLPLDTVPDPFTAIWNAPGSKEYYVGTDRGMIYLEDGTAYPWTGLISVDEKPIGGEIRPFYLDGYRRRNDHGTEEFAASIEAFTVPREFARCEGEKEIAPGLFLGNQVRETFGFSFRTAIGDDLIGHDTHYELHLVYSAMVEPTARKHQTIGANVNLQSRSFNIATVPQDSFGSLPTARIRLNSKLVKMEALSEIEYILYGRDGEVPRLPSIEEVYAILTAIPEVDVVEIEWEEPEEPEYPDDPDPIEPDPEPEPPTDPGETPTEEPEEIVEPEPEDPMDPDPTIPDPEPIEPDPEPEYPEWPWEPDPDPEPEPDPDPEPEPDPIDPGETPTETEEVPVDPEPEDPMLPDPTIPELDPIPEPEPWEPETP